MSLSRLPTRQPERSLSAWDLLRAISLPQSVRDRPLRTDRINVDHVADALRRYPGEAVTLYTRVQVAEDVANFVLAVAVPGELRVEEARCLSARGRDLIPAFDQPEGMSVLRWRVDRTVTVGETWEFAIDATVDPSVDDERTVVSRARLSAHSQEQDDPIVDEESVQIEVTAKARYLRFLPALYERDELMSRLLMLVESFWGPIERQIDSIDSYFDPAVTPEEFLPWLASWLNQSQETLHGDEPPAQPNRRPPAFLGNGFDAPNDGRADGEPASRTLARPNGAAAAIVPGDWIQPNGPKPGIVPADVGLPPLPSPAEMTRKLLRVRQQLNQSRGTRRGLQRYLEICTGAEVQIVEHRAENFVMGRSARLGRRIALGRHNHPHTFTVIIRIPLEQDVLDQIDESVLAEYRAAVRRRAAPIIEEQKPVHTSSHLQIEIIPT